MDNSAEKLLDMEGVDVHRCFDINIAFTGSIEWVRRFTESDFIWVTQDDMTVHPGFLKSILEKMKHEPELGAVAPLLEGEFLSPNAPRAGFRVMSPQGQDLWLTGPDVPMPILSIDLEICYDFVFSSGAEKFHRAIEFDRASFLHRLEQASDF